ncbi:ATP-binding protein [Ekhidna sp.]|uniref:ATP-binding protein n=1 Tax=Ekhidna sp. TaxID=2608089 RepID=UPI003CCBAD0A
MLQHHIYTLPISNKSANNIPKDVWKVYQELVGVALEGHDPAKVKNIYTEDALMIGTAAHEVHEGFSALRTFFKNQTKELQEVKFDYKRNPIKSSYATKDTYCIVDHFDMIFNGEVAFQMRISALFSHKDNGWRCSHVHASVPDINIPDDKAFPIDELERINQELEQKVKERTRELEIEAAVEKVRAQAMGMIKSKDILGVLTTFRSCLNDLQIESIASVILITNADGTIAQWDVTEMESGKKELFHIKMDLDKAPMIQKMYRRASKQSYSELHVPNKDLKSFAKELKTFDKRNGEVFNQAINDGIISEFYTSLAKFSHGFLEIDFNQKPSDEIELIGSKMASAFEQAYTRFLDLQKAENQAREAQIELALERIRAQATAMKESSDLQDIVVTMRNEFIDLGFEAHYFWHMRWLPDRYEKAMTAGDGARIGMVMKLPRHIHGDIPLVANWEKKKDPTLVFPMDAETAVTYVDKMISLGDFEQLDPNAPSLEDVRNLGGLTFIMARTTHGEIGYSLPGNIPDPPKEGIETLRRFAGAFDLAYKRFEDLKQAEQQAREAQVEAAVERVRSAAMAMHQPDDLVKVNETMLKEIAELGIKNLTGAAFILFDENDILTMWDISDPGNMGNVRDNKSIYDPRDFDVLGDFWRRWKNGEQYFVIEYDFQTVTTALEEWKKVDYENYVSLKRAIDEDKLKTQWNPFASFSRGLLTLDLMEEPDADTEKIMVKMAHTFDLAYQRFDDLQKAAEQAKEARKQASLDRIRAEIASMRNQSDLEKLTPFIWMELSTLGISFFRCGIFIMDERSKQMNIYLSTPMGESIAAMVLDFDNSEITKTASKHWKKQEIFSEKWSKEEFVSWSEDLADQGLVDSPGTYQHNELPPEKLCLQFVPFKQGMLYIGTEDFLKEKDLELIQDVADTFSIAYTRYEDFVQLEKAKRTAEDALGELRSTQSQLIHAEKMASLGELTAGIAHEIQNPLNFVNNFSDLNAELIDELNEALKSGDDEEAAEILKDLKENEEKIIHHGKRAEGIVKGMLQHSRGGDGKKELTDINALADEFLRLSYHGLRAKDKSFNAEFKCTLDEHLPKIKVLSQDIGRVFLNLINNAFHATAEQSKKDASHKPTVEVVTQKDEDYIKIQVKDNGAGIPDKIKEKIYQPFFTTKATGTGTGLGLSLSHDIISKGHGGSIELESEVGKGTTFTIRLPIHAS